MNQLHQQRGGNPENIQWEALTLQPSNPLPTYTHTHTPQAGSGMETQQLFMEQKGASYSFPRAFTWSGFVPYQHASVCVFAWIWLKENDRNFFPGQKSCLINPAQVECEATTPEPFMHEARCWTKSGFVFYMSLLFEVIHQLISCYHSGPLSTKNTKPHHTNTSDFNGVLSVSLLLPFQ